CENESIDPRRFCGFEEIKSPFDVRIQVKLRVPDRRPNSCPRSKMHDSVRLFSREDVRHGFLVPDIDFVNANLGTNRLKILFLDKRVVKIVEIVNNRDASALRQQGFNEVRTYESGASCN